MLTDLYHGHDSSLLPRLNAPPHVTDSAIMLARTWADFRWAEEATHELGAPTSYNKNIIIFLYLRIYLKIPGVKN